MELTHTFPRFPGGKSKALTFSFDDGCVEDRWIIGLFGELGLRGTFNLNSGLFAEPGEDHAKLNRDVYPVRDIQYRLTEEEAREVYSRPYVEIASHGRVHSDPAVLDTASAVWDMMADRRKLEEMFGCPVTGFAYPQGSHSDSIAEAVKSCGYEYARTAEACNHHRPPKDIYRWAPTGHFLDAEWLTDWFLNSVPQTELFNYGCYPALLHLMGHSYELRGESEKFKTAEALFRRIAGQEDVWYATNLEIARYMRAYYSLIFATECSSVYNPSACEVWFYCANGVVNVKPGETVRL